jgi:transposase InsO family protein
MYKIPIVNHPRPFSQIAMDLVTDLPKSHGFDSILTIVDHRTSRAALFLPCNKMIMGIEIAKLYYEHIYRWFGMLTRLISDRDPQFTSHFGQALTKQLDIKRNLSTAFHPQTDGLSERTNQWVEQYL